VLRAVTESWPIGIRCVRHQLNVVGCTTTIVADDMNCELNQ
jgi:hypothetical protein